MSHRVEETEKRDSGRHRTPTVQPRVRPRALEKAIFQTDLGVICTVVIRMNLRVLINSLKRGRGKAVDAICDFSCALVMNYSIFTMSGSPNNFSSTPETAHPPIKLSTANSPPEPAAPTDLGVHIQSGGCPNSESLPRTLSYLISLKVFSFHGISLYAHLRAFPEWRRQHLQRAPLTGTLFGSPPDTVKPLCFQPLPLPPEHVDACVPGSFSESGPGASSQILCLPGGAGSSPRSSLSFSGKFPQGMTSRLCPPKNLRSSCRVAPAPGCTEDQCAEPRGTPGVWPRLGASQREWPRGQH